MCFKFAVNAVYERELLSASDNISSATKMENGQVSWSLEELVSWSTMADSGGSSSSALALLVEIKGTFMAFTSRKESYDDPEGP